MHADIRPDSSITIDGRGGRVALRLEERPVIPLDGGWHPAQGSSGQVGMGMCRYQNDRLRYHERYEEGRVFHTLSVTSEGRALCMNTRITHPRFGDAVRVRFSYRRR